MGKLVWAVAGLAVSFMVGIAVGVAIAAPGTWGR